MTVLERWLLHDCRNPDRRSHRLGRLCAEGWGRCVKAGCCGGQAPAIICMWQSMLTNVQLLGVLPARRKPDHSPIGQVCACNNINASSSSLPCKDEGMAKGNRSQGREHLAFARLTFTLCPLGHLLLLHNRAGRHW